MRFRDREFSIRQAIRKGRGLPAWYLECPEIPDGAQWIIKAYWELASERKQNGSIPWSAARHWYAVSGNLESIWGLFWRCIQTIDAAYGRETDRQGIKKTPAPSPL